MKKTVAITYKGNYTSATKSTLNTEEITVNAVRFTPLDLLASAYCGWLHRTGDTFNYYCMGW